MRRLTTYTFTLEVLLSVFAIIGILMAAGCGSKSTTANASADVIPVPAPSAVSAAPAQDATTSQPGGLADPHATMDVGKTQPLTPTPDLDALIEKLQKHGSKKDLAIVYVERANARMMDPQASPHLKYPAALSDYRKALKLDPTNATAANNKKLIEEIYTGMGMPIPTD
jgi:hypothetical protein